MQCEPEFAGRRGHIGCAIGLLDVRPSVEAFASSLGGGDHGVVAAWGVVVMWASAITVGPPAQFF
jgi:hypothetical protein